MEIKTTITANLSRSDLEKVLKETLEKQMPGYVVQRVDFKVSDTSDDRFGGFGSWSLTGVDVVMVPKRAEF